MQAETEKVHEEKKINGWDGSDGSNPNACDSPVVASPAISSQTSEKSSSSDSFYEKLSKFYESSGLSLVFNFRETRLDLYLFYKDVTERGGYHQVVKDGKWGEVASALNLKGSISMSPTQLQKFYANLLYQFEQTYYYRTPAKLTEASGLTSGTGGGSSCSIQKRKHCDSSSHLSTVHFGTGDVSVGKRLCSYDTVQLPKVFGTEEKKLALKTPSKVKETKKDPDAPLGLRTAYQIFLKMECQRLNKIHGETSRGQMREMAIKAWGCLSESERQPYVEASRKDKERFNRETAAYKERKNKQNTKPQNMSNAIKPNIMDFAKTSQTDGDYHVTLQPDSENILVSSDASTVDLAVGLMKNARPNDPIFQINWDEYCGSLDIPI